jgi:hypothetical protein
MGSYRVWKAWFRQFVQSFWLPLILVLILLAAAVAVQRYFQKKETRDALRPGRAEAVQPQA